MIDTAAMREHANQFTWCDQPGDLPDIVDQLCDEIDALRTRVSVLEMAEMRDRD